MRRKLRESELNKLREKHPGVMVLRCVKRDVHVMVTWCPICFKEHRHGLVAEPFVLHSRVAHCADLSAPGYLVFWDGT